MKKSSTMGNASKKIIVSLAVIGGLIGTTKSWGVDPMAEKELGLGRDPSFESVSSHYPLSSGPAEAISVKDHTDEFQVRPNGEILWHPLSRKDNKYSSEDVGTAAFVGTDKKNNFDKAGGKNEKKKKTKLKVYMITGKAFFTAGKDNKTLGTAKKGLLDNYKPIMLTEYENSDNLKYEQTAFAWSENLSPDEPIWAFMRLKVSNLTKETRLETINWCVDFRKPTKYKKITVIFSKELKLAPGETKIVYGKLPFIEGESKAEECLAEDFNSRLTEVSSYWEQMLNKGMTINVPEQKINDAYKAWLGYGFFNPDKYKTKNDGMITIPHDGMAGFYDGYFALAAIKYCEALGVMGYNEEAQFYLNELSRYINSAGWFRGKFGNVDPGTLLWVMTNHYKRTGDKKWFAEMAPKLISVCNNLIKKRRSSMENQEKDSPYYGLIKTKIGVDNSAYGGMYTFHGDMAICIGMESFVKSLSDIAGMEEPVTFIRKEALAYRKDTERAMRLCVYEHNGLRVLPLTPEKHMYLEIPSFTGYSNKNRTADVDKQCSGHGYYSLFASMLLELQFMPAGDKDYVLLADLLEKRDGLFMGMCTFGTLGGIDHGFTYGYWINCLERNRIEQVLLGFYGTMAYGVSQKTYSGTETAHVIKGGKSVGPHLRSTMQQLRLLRNMLVREENNTLILAQAAPEHWLQDGKKIEVLNAPTYFGDISYTINSSAKSGSISVKLSPPTREMPEKILFYLRHPQRKEIKHVTVDGKRIKNFADGAITLEGLTQPAEMVVQYN